MSTWMFLFLVALVVAGWMFHPSAALAASLAFAAIVAGRARGGLNSLGLVVVICTLASALVASIKLAL